MRDRMWGSEGSTDDVTRLSVGILPMESAYKTRSESEIFSSDY